MAATLTAWLRHAAWLAVALSLTGCGESKGTIAADAAMPRDGAVEDAGCPQPVQNCAGPFGPWAGSQFQDCELEFPASFDSVSATVAGIDVFINCVDHEFGGSDAGVAGYVGGPGVSTDIVTLAIKLSGDACDLVASNPNANVYIYLFTAACSPGPK